MATNSKKGPTEVVVVASPQTVKVLLSSDLINFGVLEKAGTTIEVDPATAAWLEGNKFGVRERQ